MTRVADIINLWPSPAAFAEDLGLSGPVHARTMRLRASIPRWHWPRLIEAARLRGYAVTGEVLIEAHKGVRQAGVLPVEADQQTRSRPAAEPSTEAA